MARKAVRGYTEKSYYDNTTFKGIVATTDPLNEGSFAHMVNFDISDTGSSIKPRCGFLTTDFVIEEDQAYNTVKLKADSTLYFYEPSLQQYIFVDFSTFKFTSEEFGDYTYSINVYAVSFNAEVVEGHTNKHFVATRITNVDLDDIINILPHNDEDDYKNIRLHLTHMVLKESNARYITDEYLISKYLIKHTFPDPVPYSWIELYYRKKGSTYNDITYSDDTVVVSFVDTENIISIDSNQRNIASTQSIIPEQMQNVYPKDSTDLLYNQYPIIYVKDNDTGKYVINTSKNSDVTFIPHFLLKELDTNEEWVYTYTITAQRNNPYSNDVTYTSPVFSINNNYNIYKLLYTRLIEQINNLESEYNTSLSTDLIQLNLYASEYTFSNLANLLSYWSYFRRFIRDSNSDPLWARSIYAGLLECPDDTQGDNWVDREQIGKHTFSNSALNTYLLNVDTTDYTYMDSLGMNNSVLIYVVPFTLPDTVHVRYPFVSSTDLLDTSLHRFISNVLEEEGFTQDKYVYYSVTHRFKEYVKTHQSLNKLQLIEYMKKLSVSDLMFYIIPTKDINKNFKINPYEITSQDHSNKGLIEYKQFSLFSGIFITDEAPTSVSGVIDYLSNNDYDNVIFKFFHARCNVEKFGNIHSGDIDPRMYQIFPNFDKWKNEEELMYYIYTADIPIHGDSPNIGDVSVTPTSGNYVNDSKHLFTYFFNPKNDYDDNGGGFLSIGYNTISIPLLDPIVRNHNRIYTGTYNNDDICLFDTSLWRPYSVSLIQDVSKQNVHSHFIKSYGNLVLDISNIRLDDLYDRDYFATGAMLEFNLIPLYIPDTIEEILKNFEIPNTYILNSKTSLTQTRQISYSSYPTYIQERLIDEPSDIRNSNKWCVFHSEQGDRLVLWNNNVVYMSEPNQYYYFKIDNRITYPEKILKVIQFKNTLLVFTTINLYSIYPYEDVTQSTGVDEEGNPTTIQTKVIVYATLPVLYNLMLTEQYIDAIQVFNQMVLFYSADGQLFMIKPTATIDNDTKFTIQYFNKSANDILANYDKYMNERLQVYGYSGNYLISDKTEVNIKVQVNINYIKIFYTHKDYTYILIYDVINNYYYTYDTMSFSDIKDILFTEEGDVYVSTSTLSDKKKYLFFTIKNNRPNEIDNNIDEAIYNNFVNYDIKTELDTGVLNLNTHLKKRFRDLHTVYKNITATYLNMEVETFIDCVPAQVVLNDSIEVKSSAPNGTTEYVYDCVEIKNTNDILKQNALFDFSLFTSNKMLTYYTNIPCLGKQFRLRLRFNSKGVYKLQSYGITFKEHQI